MLHSVCSTLYAAVSSQPSHAVAICVECSDAQLVPSLLRLQDFRLLEREERQELPERKERARRAKYIFFIFLG